jgi:hypothetical protein
MSSRSAGVVMPLSKQTVPMNASFSVVLRFEVIRRLERLCGPELFYHFLAPLVRLRCALKKWPEPRLLPAAIGTGPVVMETNELRQTIFLNTALEYFPDRLASPEWFRRCSFSGLEALLEVQRRGQPSVVAFCHFGPYILLRPWLNAAGIPAAFFVAQEAGQRRLVQHLQDRVTRFPEVPTVFHPNQLREAMNFLAGGKTLIISLDHPSGKLVRIPVAGGSHFQMTTGAMRLAARQGARLFPGWIIDEGCWRYRVEVGRPVPEELLVGPTDFSAAGRHLLDEMLPSFQVHPKQCTRLLLDCFRPATA